MSNEERVFSSYYDTVEQVTALNTIYMGNVSNLSQWYLNLIKLHIFLFGKVILTDTQFYDSLFLRNISETDLDGLINFAAKTSSIEFRVRSNEELISKIFATGFVYSSVLNKNLRESLKSAGTIIRNNSIKFDGNSAESLLDAMETIYPFDIGQNSNFDLFKEQFIRLDNIRHKMPYLFRLWDKKGQGAQKLKNLPDVMNEYRDTLIVKTDDVDLSDENKETVIDEFKKEFPNRSLLSGLLCNNEEQKLLYQDFCTLYNYGIGCQHSATTIEPTLESKIDIVNHGEPILGFCYCSLLSNMYRILSLSWDKLANLFLEKNISLKRDAVWDAVSRGDRQNFPIRYKGLLLAIDQAIDEFDIGAVNVDGIAGYDTSTCANRYLCQFGGEDKDLAVTYILTKQ